MIIVESNSNFLSHKKYIIEEVLNSITKSTFQLKINESAHDYIIHSQIDDNKCQIRDIVFKSPLHQFGKLELIPQKIVKANIDKAFGKLSELNLKIFKPTENLISFNKEIFEIDVFGTMFILLTQYEDWVSTEKDIHGRLKETGSTSFNLGNTEIPVINYYLKILFKYLNRRLGTNIELIKPNKFILSLDIDHPSTLNFRFTKFIKTLLKDIIIYKDFSAFFLRILSYTSRSFKFDPYNPTAYITSLKSSYKIDVNFFFMTTESEFSKYDEHYSWNAKFMHDYLKFCKIKGFPVGYHPSYNTGENLKLFESEIQEFKNQLEEAEVNFSGWIRHHYLRLNTNYSWSKMSENNYNYDSSIGFNSNIGFKSGLCLPYPVFDLNTCSSLSLYEYPITIMDRSLINHKIDSEKIYNIINEVKENEGVMVFLAHNCELGYIKNQKILDSVILQYYNEESF